MLLPAPLPLPRPIRSAGVAEGHIPITLRTLAALQRALESLDSELAMLGAHFK